MFLIRSYTGIRVTHGYFPKTLLSEFSLHAFYEGPWIVLIIPMKTYFRIVLLVCIWFVVDLRNKLIDWSILIRMILQQSRTILLWCEWNVYLRLVWFRVDRGDGERTTSRRLSNVRSSRRTKHSTHHAADRLGVAETTVYETLVSLSRMQSWT